MKICENLRQSVLQAAIQGKLVEQRPEEGTGEELYQQIQAEKQKLIKAGKFKKEKPLSEITEDEIPFEIPDSWKWVKLGNICSICTGKKDANFGSSIGNYFFFTCAKEPIRCNSFSFSGESILMAGNGDIGNISYYFGEFEAYQRTYVLQPYMEFTYLKYVLYHLSYNWVPYNNDKMFGTAIPYIKLGNVQNYLVALPSLAEQKRIVAKIDELMAKIDDLEKTENELETLKKDFPGDMKASILQAAMQGKLTEQLPSDGDASELIAAIKAEKVELIKKKKIKKEKPINPISEDEIPFDIPENWKWSHIESITYPVGNKNNQVQTNEIKSEGLFPVVSQGQLLIDGYCNNENKVIDNLPLVMFGDHTRNVKHIEFPFVIGADGTKFHKCICVNPKYVYYWMLYAANRLRNRGYARHYSLLKKEYVPIPPLVEQKRIVDKLEQLLPLCEILQEETE